MLHYKQCFLMMIVYQKGPSEDTTGAPCERNRTDLQISPENKLQDKANSALDSLSMKRDLQPNTAMAS